MKKTSYQLSQEQHKALLDLLDEAMHACIIYHQRCETINEPECNYMVDLKKAVDKCKKLKL